MEPQTCTRDYVCLTLSRIGLKEILYQFGQLEGGSYRVNAFRADVDLQQAMVVNTVQENKTEKPFIQFHAQTTKMEHQRIASKLKFRSNDF